MSFSSVLQTIAGWVPPTAASPAPGTPPPVPAPAAAAPAASAGPTGAQVAVAIAAVTPALAAVQAAMNSPQYQTAVVVAEDIEQILADFDVPGAAIAEQVTEGVVTYGPDAVAAAQVAWPLLSPALSAWLTSGAFAAKPASDPVTTDDPEQFSRGR